MRIDERPDHTTVPAATSDGISPEELQLAARNHGLPLEALAADVTPVGLHYLLIHFDVPFLDEAAFRLSVGGRLRRELSLSMDDIRTRSRVSMAVTMECAGNGRAKLTPRPLSQPWINEAVGTAIWTGTPLAPLLASAGLEDDVVELVFTGADRGVQGGVEHDYERSLSVDEAMREDVILAYEINGEPLPPQHGYPLRLLVPGWYGMTSVKWLRAITAVAEPFEGFQMDAYRFRASEADPGSPVTRILPRSLMIPPGIPDFYTRVRRVTPGPCPLSGRAWSGHGPIASVEVSVDDGRSWAEAALHPSSSPHAWSRWTFDWEATTGSTVLSSRATDAAGNVQPVDQPWNQHGFANNQVHRVPVEVGEAAGNEAS
jgi:DMSO/TMAO reductase YedYZ molybdopterin-dependent catalytic subunit